jgi:ABC-type molybdate transport system ATPase subunit
MMPGSAPTSLQLEGSVQNADFSFQLVPVNARVVSILQGYRPGSLSASLEVMPGKTREVALSGAGAIRALRVKPLGLPDDAITREDARGVLVSLATEAGYILSRITPEALTELQLEQGKQAWAVVKAHAL